MIDLAIEALESALLPCSFVLLLPGAATVLAARQEAAVALVGFIIGSLGLAWLRFSGNGGDFERPIIAMAFAASAALLVVPLIRRLDILALSGGLLAGSASVTLWQPCVGEQFGTLLGQLPERGVIGAGLLCVYVLGVLAPVVALGAIIHIIPDPLQMPVRPVMMAVGGGVLGLFALLTAAGLDDELVSKLVELSTP